VTADKKLATILTPDMVSAGVHINAVGGDCPGKTEIHKDILLSSSIFVEYEPQTRIEGDIQQLDDNHPVTEVWHLIKANQTGRVSDEEVTVFDSVGFALEDYSALRMLLDISRNESLGEHIELVPALNDPRNLFSLTKNGVPCMTLRKAL
jgi:ornithine cyclodeaminase